MQIKEVMTHNPIVLMADDTLQDAAAILSDNNIDSAPVVDADGCLLGMFTKSDFFKAVKDGYVPLSRVRDVMTKGMAWVNEEDHGNTLFDRQEEKFPVIDSNGKLKGIVTKTDLLKAYYERLQYAINSLNAVLESASNAIIAIDRQKKITVFNRAAEQLLNMKASEVLGKQITDILPNSHLPHVLETGEREISKVVDIGDKVMVTNRTPIMQYGRITGALAVFQDITDYEAVLEELDNERNTTRVLTTILDIAYDGIVVVDREGYITMMSDAYTKFLGVKAEEVIGKHVTEVIENTRMHIVVKTGRPEIADLQKIKGNYMIASRIPIIKNGEVTGAVGKVLFREVSDLNALYQKISNMEKELEHYKDELRRANQAKYSFESIIGESRAISEAKSFARKAAKTDSNVLLMGESGTGKEIFAHAIHNGSHRSYAPFIKINCAAIPAQLLESELFGYEEGAFTGAKKGGKPGKFELANGGTLFLDEIGDMPLQMQAKLLRVLQDKEIERIGATKPQQVDVRIIAATNHNLEKMVKGGKFRADLFYRLNVLTINIPPLRERIGDIELLTYNFIDKIANKTGKHIERVSEEAMKYLKNHSWHGNVRELENVIERAIGIIEKDVVIRPEHLPAEITGEILYKDMKSLKDIVDQAEKQAIIDCLRVTEGNRSRAAKLLDISRSSLYEKMDKYGI